MKLRNALQLSSIFVLFLCLGNVSSFSQCSILGLDPTYCVDDAAVTLSGSPGGGTFSGPGMAGAVFNPAVAGVGVHTITYTLPGAGNKYYIKSNIGNPWGNTSNNTAMDNAFGVAAWTLGSFEFSDPATVFSPTTSFVFLEGSDAHALELNTFLVANLPLIEAWVTAGGSLLLNAAPNEGGDINFGFGATTLDYPVFAGTVNAVDPSHPAFLGPFTPTATTMTGPYYAHSRILGSGYTNVLTNGGNVILCEKPWGAGTVMMGGMTTSNYHSPSPHGNNFRANILVYLESLALSESCTVTQDVEVFALPTVTASVDDDEICLGESVIFNGGGADTYVWDGGVTNGIAFTPIGAGTTTYTVTGTNTTTTCQNTATIDLTVNPLPVVTASADFTEICLGDAVVFNGGGADSYSWDVPGVTNGLPYTPASAGTVTYTVTGTNSVTGCQNTASIDVTVYDNPIVTATATPDEICLGESVIFTGGGADTYVWDGGITDGIAFTPLAAGTFTYTVTGSLGALGCENTATVDITVHNLPTVTASVDDAEICLGESAIFNGGGADTYVWDGGVTNGIAFTPIAAGTITYTVTGTNTTTGCQNTATVDLTVNPLPIVTASVDMTGICLGESVIFNGGGADSYTWDIPGVTNGLPYTPPSTGSVTYTVTGTNTVTGCQNTASVDVTVYDTPLVTATASPIEICLGESIVFTGGGADTYVWDGGVTDGIAFTPVAPGTFTYTVIGSIGGSSCEATATVEVTIRDLPDVTASVDDDEICLGESVIFNGGGADTYVWDGGVTNGLAFTPVTAGTTTYTVIGTHTTTGCQSSATVDLTVNALPIVTANVDFEDVCLGNSVILTGGGADTYTWNVVGVTNGIAYTPWTVGPTTYTVTGTNALTGCQNTASITVNVIDCEEVISDFTFDDNICVGDCIQLTDLSSGTPHSWAWDFGGGADPDTSDVQHPIICFNTPGEFVITLSVTNFIGTISTETATITVNEMPTVSAQKDTIITIGGTAILAANASTDGIYHWSPDFHIDCENCAITTAQPTDSVTYYVLFTDENGCQASNEVMVLVNFVQGIGVPTAFSPNGDGNNDILYVKGFSIENLNFSVYNRYGEMVFQTDDQRIGWDGKFKGRDENPGVVTWVVQYNLVNGKKGTLKGNTTLIR